MDDTNLLITLARVRAERDAKHAYLCKIFAALDMREEDGPDWDAYADLHADPRVPEQILELKKQLKSNVASPAAWPSKCPITGDEFFMLVEHEEFGMVPTYGGPYDSYTIPERDGNGSFSRARYDHDAGAWGDGVEDVPYVVIARSAYEDLEDRARGAQTRALDEALDRLQLLLKTLQQNEEILRDYQIEGDGSVRDIVERLWTAEKTRTEELAAAKKRIDELLVQDAAEYCGVVGGRT